MVSLLWIPIFEDFVVFHWKFIEMQYLITNCIDTIIGHEYTYPWNIESLMVCDDI